MADPKTTTRITERIKQFLQAPYPGDALKGSWSYWQLLAARFAILFFALFIIPLDLKFYREFFSLDLQFYHLLQLARYQPEWVALSEPGGVPVVGIASFANWLIVAAIAGLLSLVWSRVDINSNNLTAEIGWLRVAVRYRLGLALIAYGIYQLFRLQIPYPSLSSLVTNYGDLYPWKIYYQTTAISPVYSSFLGAVEIIAGLLILNRRTVTFGAGLVIGFLGNVAAVNGFYDVGELSLSTLIVLMAVFLFSFDAQRLYQLLIAEKTAVANHVNTDYAKPGLLQFRQIALLGFVVFTGVLLISAVSAHRQGSYKYPAQQGLPNSFGLYQVSHFSINNDSIPYSASDPRRWQDVVFEKWSTISIKQNRPVTIDKSSGERYQSEDIDRNYELAGLAGRHFYHYQVSRSQDSLLLTNKNPHQRNESFRLAIKRPTESVIELSGTDHQGNLINVTLQRQHKKFMMYEGRRKAARL